MPNFDKLQLLQTFIDQHLIRVPNSRKHFGEQLLVNEQEEILGEEEFLLINAIDKDVNEISNFVYEQGGIFIPAHINRHVFSLTSQLGFVPPDLKCHALEITRHISVSDFVKSAPYLKNHSFIQSSDAHYIADIGSAFTNFYLEKLNFAEIKMALARELGRYCQIPE